MTILLITHTQLKILLTLLIRNTVTILLVISSITTSWTNSNCESEELLEINIDAVECNTSIEEINSNEDKLIGIFDLQEEKMQNELNELPFGVYIVMYEGKSSKIIKH